MFINMICSLVNAYFPQAVSAGDVVRLGKRGVIEHRCPEVIDGSSLAHNHLRGTHGDKRLKFALQQWSLYGAGVCTIEGNEGIIAAIGTTPHAASAGRSRLMPRDFAGTTAGNRHYSTGTTERHPLYRRQHPTSLFGHISSILF